MLKYYVYCEFRIDLDSDPYRILTAKFHDEKDALYFCKLKNDRVIDSELQRYLYIVKD